MTYFAENNILELCDYSIGGVSSAYLLDIRDFGGYKFANDGLYDSQMVDSIDIKDEYIAISTNDQSSFTESYSQEIYTQDLSLFVQGFNSDILRSLIKIRRNKYLATFKTNDGKAFTFGSDGGCSVSFTQTTGKTKESSGYTITVSKKSIYPLFGVSLDQYNKNLLWLFEDSILQDKGILFRNGILK